MLADSYINNLPDRLLQKFIIVKNKIKEISKI